MVRHCALKLLVPENGTSIAAFTHPMGMYTVKHILGMYGGTHSAKPE
jgi:hypothetical protein